MQAKFKVGDKVKKKSGQAFSNGSYTLTVEQSDSDCWVWLKETRTNIGAGELELADKPVFEDEWHLNTGGVEIPDDAEKLMNPEGTSVVAFRYLKKPEVHKEYRYVSVTSRGLVFNYQEPTSSAKVKVTYTVTDGEITDITWEKL